MGPKEGEGLKPLFSRPFIDWKVEEVDRCLSLIERESMVDEFEDKMKWEKDKDGVFFNKVNVYGFEGYPH